MTSAAWLDRFTAEAIAAWRNRERDPIGSAERTAIATQPREANPYTPEQPDVLRDGLAAGFRNHRRAQDAR